MLVICSIFLDLFQNLQLDLFQITLIIPYKLHFYFIGTYIILCLHTWLGHNIVGCIAVTITNHNHPCIATHLQLFHFISPRDLLFAHSVCSIPWMHSYRYVVVLQLVYQKILQICRAVTLYGSLFVVVVALFYYYPPNLFTDCHHQTTKPSYFHFFSDISQVALALFSSVTLGLS